jgi:hypothetical protein
MRRPRVLLVNPPIVDFAAYDFWLRPYGLLSVAGQLRGRTEITLFDHLDRLSPFVPAGGGARSDPWGRGRFPYEHIDKPACLKSIPRYFQRFGLPRHVFREFLRAQEPFDFALIQTVMTYWYPAVEEAVKEVRHRSGQTKIVLGGHYATTCGEHAAKLGADLVVAGLDLEPLWQLLQAKADPEQPASWEAYQKLNVGVLKLTEGCPFACTYCSVPKIYGDFRPRSLQRSLAELELLVSLGVRNIAFYDDALLFDVGAVLVPFLEEVVRRGVRVNFHTPNAINARFLNPEIARLMVRAGFKSFYLGFESHSRKWQQGTGGKVYSDELGRAVDHLASAGAEPSQITAYQIVGHPNSDVQELEASMRFVRQLGVRGTLADFSPIPGTADGEACRRWVDMDEPLMHNKTAFPIIRLGFDEVNRLKEIQRRLNRELQ